MMVKFKISKDGNEKKYIPLIRKNIIEAHFDTERYLQETDDKVNEQD